MYTQYPWYFLSNKWDTLYSLYLSPNVITVPIQKGTHILYSYKAFTANFRRIFQSVQLIQLNDRNIWIDKAVSTAMGTYVPISWTCDISLVKINKLKLNCLQTPGFGKGHQSYQNNVLVITWPYLSAPSLSSLKCTCLAKENFISHEFK